MEVSVLQFWPNRGCWSLFPPLLSLVWDVDYFGHFCGCLFIFLWRGFWRFGSVFAWDVGVSMVLVQEANMSISSWTHEKIPPDVRELNRFWCSEVADDLVLCVTSYIYMLSWEQYDLRSRCFQKLYLLCWLIMYDERWGVFLGEHGFPRS